MAAYIAALLIGVAFAAWVFPIARLFPPHPLALAFTGDEAQHVIGQRYFIRDAWRWPLLVVPRLGAPDGVNIAFTDSIPLAALVLKLLRGWLPDGFTVTEGWVAIAYALQPLAAVFALRSAGERRLIPALAVVAVSLNMPTVFIRIGHEALCSHFVLLTAIGLYFRLTSPAPGRSRAAILPLLLTGLLIHPYLLCMAAIVIGAAPLTLLLRRDRRWLGTAAWVALCCALVAGAALALGYGGAKKLPGGFGLYSMNLIAPILPDRSVLFPMPPLDATGGQALEGFQYLGAGLLLLAVVAAASSLLRRRSPFHGGLVIVCVGLFAFALSNKVYAGHDLLLDIGEVPDAIEQFHATGRFFWPVAYVVLVASIAGLGRRLPAVWLMPLLLAAAALQVVDTAELRAADYGRERDPTAWSIPYAALQPVLATAREITLWPVQGCGVTVDRGTPYMEVLLLASAANLVTNTMYTARLAADPDCDPAPVLSAPWRPGEIRLLLPPASAGNRLLVPDFIDACRSAGDLIVCAAQPETLEGLKPIPHHPVPRGEMLVADAPSIRDILVSGWEPVTGPNVWSVGPEARIVADLAPPGPPMHLTARVSAMARVPGGVQPVEVVVGGKVLTTWNVPEFVDSVWDVDLPPGRPGPLDVTLRILEPVRPIDLGLNSDPRPLGLLLRAVRID